MSEADAQPAVAFVVPTHADILDGLRVVSGRQVEMYIQPLVFSELLRREFIVCEYEDHPVSKQDVDGMDGTYPGVSITGHGCAALDWLLSIARSPQWDHVRWLRYGD